MIYIINYGIGNLGSVKNMFKKVGVEAHYATSVEHIMQATKLVLPGVGAFDSCMSALNNSGMLASIEKQVLEKKIPLLGICVGYQMLTKSSEEGALKGLGWFDAETVKFQSLQGKYKVPHMGWNYIEPTGNHVMTRDFIQTESKAKAYFVHSYYVKPVKSEDMILKTNYIQDFASGMAKENIVGVQFHPEKSHRFGMSLFKSFSEFEK